MRAAGVVRAGADAAIRVVKCVVMFRTSHRGAAEPRADLEPHRRGEGHHRLRQISLEFIKNRFAESDGDIARYGFNHAAERIAFPPCRINPFRHRRAHVRIWASHWTCLYLLQRYRIGVNSRCQGMNLLDVSEDFRLARLAQELFGNRATGDTADGFARAGPAAALPIPNPVFLLICKIGVRRTIDILQVFVI